MDNVYYIQHAFYPLFYLLAYENLKIMIAQVGPDVICLNQWNKHCHG